MFFIYRIDIQKGNTKCFEFIIVHYSTNNAIENKVNIFYLKIVIFLFLTTIQIVTYNIKL